MYNSFLEPTTFGYNETLLSQYSAFNWLNWQFNCAKLPGFDTRYFTIILILYGCCIFILVYHALCNHMRNLVSPICLLLYDVEGPLQLRARYYGEHNSLALHPIK